jgi:hypothetical protein
MKLHVDDLVHVVTLLQFQASVTVYCHHFYYSVFVVPFDMSGTQPAPETVAEELAAIRRNSSVATNVHSTQVYTVYSVTQYNKLHSSSSSSSSSVCCSCRVSCQFV